MLLRDYQHNCLSRFVWDFGACVDIGAVYSGRLGSERSGQRRLCVLQKRLLEAAAELAFTARDPD
jgi:hypothetical protein